MSPLRLTEILTFKVTLSEQKQAKLAFWPFLSLHKIVFFPSHTSILAEVTHVYANIHIPKFHTCQLSRFTVMVVQSFKKCKFCTVYPCYRLFFSVYQSFSHYCTCPNAWWAFFITASANPHRTKVAVNTALFSWRWLKKPDSNQFGLTKVIISSSLFFTDPDLKRWAGTVGNVKR